MNSSGCTCVCVTAESRVSEVVHKVLGGMGWTVRDGRGAPANQLEIIDFSAYRRCSVVDQDDRFPRLSHRRGDRACVLVCRPDEYPDAPHDRFDAVVTAPLSAARLTALVTALFPPSGAEAGAGQQKPKPPSPICR